MPARTLDFGDALVAAVKAERAVAGSVPDERLRVIVNDLVLTYGKGRKIVEVVQPTTERKESQ